jgi:hypothetical protein
LGIPLPFTGEFEVVIVIEVVIEEMHGSDRVSEPEMDYERAWVGCAQFIYESEMALFPECTEWCAQKVGYRRHCQRCDFATVTQSLQSATFGDRCRRTALRLRDTTAEVAKHSRSYGLLSATLGSWLRQKGVKLSGVFV